MEIIDHYGQAPIIKKYEAVKTSKKHLHEIALRNISLLSQACQDKAVQRAIQVDTPGYEPVYIPIMVHKVTMNGRAVWVIVSVDKFSMESGVLECGIMSLKVIEVATGQDLFGLGGC